MENVSSEIWGESEVLIEVKTRLSKAAKVNRPILIVGERGTGKELAAARIHYLSPRWKGPYLTLNCAALNPNLLESELFGYEPGAFTGAAKVNRGRFEAANGGTLFLDEISHLSPEAQAKILRVVEYGSFQRLGSTKEMTVDVRLVSATNADLKERADQGLFLPDLLDRLSFEVIKLPPLREREGDIGLLAHLFAARMAREMGLDSGAVFSPEALDLLERHSWPGNVRELKNTVERAVYKQQGQTIQADDLDFDLALMRVVPLAVQDKLGQIAARPKAENDDKHINWPLAEGEFDSLIAARARALFDCALNAAAYNQTEAARLLGLSYHRFRFLRRKFSQKTGRPQKP